MKGLSQDVKDINSYQTLMNRGDVFIEGAYSGPLYGGNKDIQGWKMREYLGLRASYINLIESEDFQKLDPISLENYQQSPRNKETLDLDELKGEW